MLKNIFFILFLFNSTYSFTQDVSFARNIVDTLSSSTFWGRGYTKNGMQKAAKFLVKQFKDYGLQSMSKNSFSQTYNYSVNTFPADMQLSINGIQLIAGSDFIVNANSSSINNADSLQQIDSVTYANRSKSFIVKLVAKLTMTVSQTVANTTTVFIDKNKFTQQPHYYVACIKNKFISHFLAQNIFGIVKGITYPDSLIIISAHYDHLGGLGKNVYFPGANDNASGVALLLNLAKYYAKNPQPFSVGFILFSGEEAGLLGSKYFVENPLVDLHKIKFLINTDLAGTGVDGITVCNATEFPQQFKLLLNINDELHLLKAINSRGKAANSDHYWFTQNGVPSFFFYTLGGITAYHDVFDKAETLPLTEHEDLFILVTEFIKRLMP